MKTFEQWDIDDVERTFGLSRTETLSELETWLSAQHLPDDGEKSLILRLQNDLRGYVDLWNEDELKFKFIAPFISLVGYNTKKFQAFTQRSLSATVNNIKLTGRVDFLVATGKSKPIQPFFFLHEYKKTRGRENDPLAQLLVEMLAAQELNHHAFPLYGCYIIGRNWYFVVLQAQQYAESRQFSALDGDDIWTLFSILREAKAIITRLAEQFG
jgi:hypothetical protein